MDNKKDNFINGLYCNKGNQDWKPVRLGINVEQFQEELIKLKPKANKGFINIDVCWSKDGNKLYAVLDDYIAKEKVTSSQQNPDRDLPF
jgi:hypothetical protein